jgi:endo-1,4-beta-xylanase
MKILWLAPVFMCCMTAWAVTDAPTTFPEPDQLPVLKELPDPFLMRDGQRVSTREEWAKRRLEITEMLLHYEYGHLPPAPASVLVEEETVRDAFDGKARVHEFVLRMNGKDGFSMHAGVIVPTAGGPKFPVVVAVNPVYGPHGEATARQVIERGYAFAGFAYHDVDNDKDDRSVGVYPFYPDSDGASLIMWAWGAMRVVDCLAARSDIDMAKIAVTGHSRCGKAALLAGALDERFALVVPHASGAGGSGSFRIQPKGVETLDFITKPDRFHYWFSPRLRAFVKREDRLPFDQHFLKALVAPRALLEVIGLGDLWANPEGTRQTHLAVLPVFEFLDARDKAALWVRDGGHDEEPQDWTALLDFADFAFFDKPLPSGFNAAPAGTVSTNLTWSAPAQSSR